MSDSPASLLVKSDGTEIATAANPVRTDPTGTTTQPVSGPLTDTQLRATAVPVSGTFWQATQPVSIAASVAVTGPLTDTQLRASSVPVTGPLTDTQLRATAVPVSGTFYPATQPVSGTVTANAGTGPFPVSDNGGSLTVDGTVAISGSVAVTGPLTDTQLRATAVPISAAALPLPSGASTSALQTTGNTSLDNIDTKLPSLGQKTMANSQPCTIASDQSTLPVREAANTTATLSNVSGSASNVTLLASNANRRGATIFNDSTANLYVKFGTTASTTSFTVLMRPAAYFEVPFGYTGRIDGIWSAANGAARVTEVTA